MLDLYLEESLTTCNFFNHGTNRQCVAQPYLLLLFSLLFYLLATKAYPVLCLKSVLLLSLSLSLVTVHLATVFVSVVSFPPIARPCIYTPLPFSSEYDIKLKYSTFFWLWYLAKIVPKAGDIKDASAFLRMRTSEKRACLRASGKSNPFSVFSFSLLLFLSVSSFFSFSLFSLSFYSVSFCYACKFIKHFEISIYSTYIIYCHF